MAEIKKINTELQLESALRDASGSTGTSGQILSSTGTVTDWVTLSEIQGVDGSGTANYISKWSDSDTITDSIILEQNSGIGIGGSVQSGFKLDIAGNSVNRGSFYLSGNIEYFGSSDLIIRTGSTNNIKLLTNNSEHMRIDTLGNVGIGTTNPDAKLTVFRPVSSYAINLSDTESRAGLSVKSSSGWDSKLTISTGDSSRQYIQAVNDAATQAKDIVINPYGGNVGIGTTSPTVKLDVNGEIAIRGGEGADDARMYFRASDQSNRFTIETDFDGTSTNDILGFRSFNTDNILTLKGNGNVGIGTLNASAKLDVEAGNIGTTLGDTVTAAIIRAGRQNFIFKDVRTAAGNDWIDTTFKLIAQIDATDHQSIDFVNDGNYREHIDIRTGNQLFHSRFTYDGNLGIGTTSPSYKLDVAGEGKVTGKFRVGGAVMLAEPGTGVLLFGSEGGTQTAIYSSSQERIRINSSGNVGIGTTNPAYKLDVDGAATFSGNVNLIGTGNLTIRNTSGTGSGIIFVDQTWQAGIEHDSGKIIFRTGGQNDRMIISSGGNVGIGTTSPSRIFTIENNSGSFRINTSTSTYPRIELGSSSGSTAAIINRITGSQNIIFGESSDSGNYIFRGGNVGVGNTSPGTKLHVGIGSGATVDTGYQMVIDSAGIAGLQILSATTQSGRIVFGDSGDNDIGMIKYDHTDNSMGFRTNGSGNERMRITSAGNVGIGTTSPASALDINGTITLSGDTEHQIKKGTSNSYGLGGGETTEMYGRNILLSAYDDVVLRAGSSDEIRMFAGNETSARMTIDPNGDVGIGTTNPGAKLDVNGNIQTTGTRSISALFDANHYIRLESNSGGGVLKGTDGGVITTIVRTYGDSYFNGGNVGIGTTSPGAKLDVAGSAPVIRLTDTRNLNVGDWDNVSLGKIEFYTSDTTSPGARVLAEVEAYSGVDAASGPEAELRFKTSNNNDASPVQRMVIDAQGRVGIGTTSPSAPLTVVGVDSVGIDDYILHNGDSNTKFGFPSNDTFKIRTSGTDRFNIDSSGNIGIGTTSPLQTFDLDGVAYLRGGTAADFGSGDTQTNVAAIIDEGDYIYTRDGNYLRRLIGKNNSTDTIEIGQSGTSLIDRIKLSPGTSGGIVTIYNDNSEYVRFNGANQSVGIGTTNPTAKLEVNGDIKSQKDVILPSPQQGTVTTAMGAYKGGYTITMPETNQMAGNPYFMSDLAYFTKKGGTVTVTGLTSSLSLDTVFRPDAGIYSVSGSAYTGSTFTIELSDIDDVSLLTYGTRIGIAFGSTSFMPSSMLIEYSTDSGTNYTTALNSSKENHFYYTYVNNGGSAITNIKFTIGLPFYSNVNQIRITNIFATDYAGDGMKNYFVPADGGNYYGDVSFKDNKNLKFGDNNDLKIYHNGSDSYIDEVGTGDLIIRSNSQLIAKTFAGETMFKGVVAGAFEAYYDNSKKFETTSSGVYVGGSITGSSTIGNKGTNIGQQLEVGDSSLTTLRFDADAWRIYAGGSGSSGEALRVTEAGDVGIGQTSPVAKLDINKSGFATNGTTTQGIKVNSTRGGWANTTLYGLNSIAEVDGRIGITNVFGVRGIANYTNDYSAHTTTVNQGSLIGLYSEINLNYVAGEAPINLAFGVKAGAPTISTSSHLQNYFGVYVEEPVVNGSLTNKYAIVTEANAGNVGIGTITPSEKLDVAGVARFDTGITEGVHYVGTSLEHWGDGGTGVSFPANDTISLKTSSSDRVYITSNGNVGIGTTSPTAPLTVKSNSVSSQSSGIVLQANGSTDDIIRMGEKSTNGGRLHMLDGGVEKIAFYTDGTDNHISAGNVGIGTTSPSSLLHLESASSPALQIKDTTNNVTFKAYAQDSNSHLANTSNHDLFIDTNSTSRITVKAGGNVGIGTTSPSNKLDVNGTASVTDLRVGSSASGEGIIRHSSTGGQGIGITTGSLSSSGIGLYVSHTSNNRNVGIGTTSPSEKLHVNAGTGNTVALFESTDARSRIVLKDNSGEGQLSAIGDNITFATSSSATERMRITSSGNVGIGTTSPIGKFHVQGNSTFVGDMQFYQGSTSNKYLHILQSSNNTYINTGTSGETIYFGAPASNTTNVSVQGDIESSLSSSGLILKSPNGTRYRITVDNSGNLTTTAI